MSLSRRDFLSITAAGAVLPLAPGVRVAIGAPLGSQNNILVYIFLRDGMDGLQLVAPAADRSYRDNRPAIAVRTSGVGAGIPLGSLDGVPFFMHPSALLLKRMYDAGSLAIVHAAGVKTYSRSHFQSQALVDMGIAANEPEPPNGWLTRHFITKPALSGFAATADITTGSTPLGAMRGVIPTGSLESLPLTVDPARAQLIGALNTNGTTTAQSVRETIDLIETIRVRTAGLPPRDASPGNYTPGAFSESMRSLARVIKLGFGVEAASVDFRGAWDTHQAMQITFPAAAEALSDGLFAFTDDLGPLMSRVTIVVMTEFGRRVEENTSAGTDHGEASVMLALGAGVRGGKIYGQWPGLADAQLSGGDLHVTTDYRQLLSEVLVNRLGQPAIDQVFPNIKYAPLGIVTSA